MDAYPSARLENAVALWDVDVENIIEQSIIERQGESRTQALLQTNEYLKQNKIFDTPQDAIDAKNLIQAFNEQSQNAISLGLAPPHPILSSQESATLLRLHIFDVDQAFAIFPKMADVWEPHRHELQDLLQAVAQKTNIATDLAVAAPDGDEMPDDLDYALF